MQEGTSPRHMIRPEKAEDWEPYRELITDLYAENTLTSTIEEMKAVYSFSATPKQYKTKIKEWGLANKYVKDFEYEELLNQGDQNEYTVRGKRVTHQDVERFKRRKEKNSKDGSHSKSKGGRGDYYSGGDNAGEGSSGGGNVVVSEHYIDYSGASSGTGYVTSGGEMLDYSGYEYDNSGTTDEAVVYNQQQGQGGYSEQSGYGAGEGGWSY